MRKISHPKKIIVNHLTMIAVISDCQYLVWLKIKHNEIVMKAEGESKFKHDIALHRGYLQLSQFVYISRKPKGSVNSVI